MVLAKGLTTYISGAEKSPEIDSTQIWSVDFSQRHKDDAIRRVVISTNGMGTGVHLYVKKLTSAIPQTLNSK